MCRCALCEKGGRLREVHSSSSSPSSSLSSPCVQGMIKIGRYSSSSRTSNLNLPRLRPHLLLTTILLSNPPPPHQPSRQQLLNHTRIHPSAKIHIPRRRRRRRRKKKTMMMMILWKRRRRRRHTYTPFSSSSSYSSSNTFIPYSSSSCSSICNGFSILGLNRRWNRFFLSSFFFLKRSFFEGLLLLLLLLLLFPSAAVRGTAARNHIQRLDSGRRRRIFLVDGQLSSGWCCWSFLLHGSSFDDYW